MASGYIKTKLAKNIANERQYLEYAKKMGDKDAVERIQRRINSMSSILDSVPDELGRNLRKWERARLRKEQRP